MKLDITEEEFQNGLLHDCTYGSVRLAQVVMQYVRGLGITFKQEIYWEAETHDPSVIPDKWLIEKWDNGYQYRWIGFMDKKNNDTYENYRAIKKEDWPKWAIEAHKSSED